MSQAFPILIKFLDKSKIYSSDFQTKEDFSWAWKNVLTNAYTDNAKLKCSGSMIPDTNVGGKIATINEVSDDQKATFFFS